MLERVLLLCDEVERPFLTDTLRAGAPDIDIRPVSNVVALGGFDQALLKQSRLVAFGTARALPPAVLNALGYGAYNFHPGPPAYPGWTPAAFAVYDGAIEFGATAHAVSAASDGGTIVGVDMFPVAPGTTPADLAQAAYLAMLGLFRRLAPALVALPQPLPTLPIVWGEKRTTRALFADLCDIPLDIEKSELLRRINAFGGGDDHSAPTVWLHGIPFRYAPGGEGQK